MGEFKNSNYYIIKLLLKFNIWMNTDWYNHYAHLLWNFIISFNHLKGIFKYLMAYLLVHLFHCTFTFYYFKNIVIYLVFFSPLLGLNKPQRSHHDESENQPNCYTLCLYIYVHTNTALKYCVKKNLISALIRVWICTMPPLAGLTCVSLFRRRFEAVGKIA